MSSPSFPPDEIRAAAEIHHELGPDYQGAVIESFLDKVGKEIDARVDARMAAAQMASGYPAEKRRSSFPASAPIAIVSIVMGIPLTAIVMSARSQQAGLIGLVVIWAAIAAINIGYSVHRPPHGSR